MELEAIIEAIGLAIDVLGTAVIIGGAVLATILVIARIRSGAPFEEAYGFYRRALGRAIILGLEFMVAGDIIRTVVVAPTIESVAVLGVIVLIRTFLSFSLEIELQGRLPWRRAREEAG